MISNIGLILPSGILRFLGFLPICKGSKESDWKLKASRLYLNVFSVLRFSAYLIYVPSVIYHDVFLSNSNTNLISKFYGSLNRFPWAVALIFMYGFLKLHPLSKLEDKYNKFRKKFLNEMESDQHNEWSTEIWALILFVISNGYYLVQCTIMYSEISDLSFKGIIYVWDLFGALTIFNWNCLLYYYLKQLSNVLQKFSNSFEKRDTHLRVKGKSRKNFENIYFWKKMKKRLLILLKYAENINENFNTPFSLLFAVDIFFILFALTGYVVSSKFDKKELAMILEPCIKVVFSMHISDLIQIKVNHT